MVVEEVSLVDRANKHRFLIVKRDDAMDDVTNKNSKANDSSSASKEDDESPLGAAIAALESLTALVEMLGSLGANQADERLNALARELRSVAEQILSRTGWVDTEDENDARAKSEPDASDFATNLTAAKHALSRLSELASKAAPTPAEPREATNAPSTELTESLAKLADSFRVLSETVKEQQQRLGRVEKHFGLPNSAAPAEQIAKANAEDVGWPIDLNKPKDRENVDKAVSFHDL